MQMDKEKELPKRKHPRLDNYDYSSAGAYFITICTQNRRCVLSRIVGRGLAPAETTAIEYTSLGEIAEKQLFLLADRYPYLTIDQYVIMPDHIHLLISIHNGEDTPEKRTSRIARFIGTFKRFCNKEYGENIWQGRFHDHVIRNQQDYDETWEYIANNPRKWAITRHILE